jgi:hypothetical protein
MTYDIKIKQDKIYLIEKDESITLVKKQKKIFVEAGKNLKKVIIDRIEGKNGEC